MFKISEVAGKLNVETYVIFEKLFTYADLFKDHTEKVHSISYIDEVGINIIQALIEGKSVDEIEKQLTGSDIEEVIESRSEQSPNSDLSPEVDTMIETDDEDWLTEEDLQLIDAEKQKLRDEVSQLRRELIQYDSELKRLDDAIANYQILMREDIDYLLQTEKHLEQKLFQKMIMSKDEEQQSNRFSFMRK